MPAYLARHLQNVASLKPPLRHNSLIESGLALLVKLVICSSLNLFFLMAVILLIDGRTASTLVQRGGGKVSGGFWSFPANFRSAQPGEYAQRVSIVRRAQTGQTIANQLLHPNFVAQCRVVLQALEQRGQFCGCQVAV